MDARFGGLAGRPIPCGVPGGTAPGNAGIGGAAYGVMGGGMYGPCGGIRYCPMGYINAYGCCATPPGVPGGGGGPGGPGGGGVIIIGC